MTIGHFDGSYTITDYLTCFGKKHYFSWKCKDGVLVFSNVTNDVKWAILRGKDVELARKVFNSAKKCNSKYLKGRTFWGIYCGLYFHYFCYILDIKSNSSKEAHMGAAEGKLGKDPNAWWFETEYALKEVKKLLKNYIDQGKAKI